MGRQWLLAKREVNAKRKSGVTSKLVKEIALYGGAIGKFVSATVEADVVARVTQLGLKGER